MTNNSDALKRSRQKESTAKRRRAGEVLQAMIEAGEPVTFPAVARRADVSVSLLYADRELASRLVEARARQQEAGTDRAWRLPTRSLVTEQSLHADLANARDRVRRLTEELSVLRDRLARELGAGSDAAIGRGASSLLGQLEEKVARLEADNLELRARTTELEETLRESDETLAAARAMNRELMTEINRTTDVASTAASSTTGRAHAGRELRSQREV